MKTRHTADGQRDFVFERGILATPPLLTRDYLAANRLAWIPTQQWPPNGTGAGTYAKER
jgi:hypothetical protein